MRSDIFIFLYNRPLITIVYQSVQYHPPHVILLWFFVSRDSAVGGGVEVFLYFSDGNIPARIFKACVVFWLHFSIISPD